MFFTVMTALSGVWLNWSTIVSSHSKEISKNSIKRDVEIHFKMKLSTTSGRWLINDYIQVFLCILARIYYPPMNLVCIQTVKYILCIPSAFSLDYKGYKCVNKCVKYFIK